MPETVYSREQIDQWQQNMEQLAQQPRTSFTKKQVVVELFDAIDAALENRSYEEITEALQADGLDISVSSLRKHISSCRQERAGAKNRRKPSASKAKKTETSSTPAQPATPLSEPAAATKVLDTSAAASTKKTAAKKTTRARVSAGKSAAKKTTRTGTRSRRTKATANSKTKA